MRKLERIEIKDFGMKLDLLEERNPDIRNDTQLAQKLGCSKALISSWRNGTDTVRGNLISSRYIKPICDLFLIESVDFTEKPFQEFKDAIANRPAAWQALLVMAKPSEALRIVSQERQSEMTRGLVEFEDEMEGLDQFAVGEEVTIEVEGKPDWSVILISQDGSGWTCLRPSEKHPSPVIDGSSLCKIPPRGHFNITEPRGILRIVAILGKGLWMEQVYHFLQDKRTFMNAIDHIVTTLRATDPVEWAVLERQCNVV